jgi:hypothetical protein
MWNTVKAILIVVAIFALCLIAVLVTVSAMFMMQSGG